MQLCSSLSIVWHCLSLGLEWKLTFSSPVATAEFSKFDKVWFTGEGNGKPFQYSCLGNSMNSMKTQKDRTLKDELSRSVGAQYATGDQWRNNSRKNEEIEPKQNNTQLGM